VAGDDAGTAGDHGGAARRPFPCMRSADPHSLPSSRTRGSSIV
jgi:hypothetical protein